MDAMLFSMGYEETSKTLLCGLRLLTPGFCTHQCQKRTGLFDRQRYHELSSSSFHSASCLQSVAKGWSVGEGQEAQGEALDWA